MANLIKVSSSSVHILSCSLQKYSRPIHTDIFKIFHHIGAPVVEYLQPPEFYIAFLNINPCIRHNIIDCFEMGCVFKFQLFKRIPTVRKFPVHKPVGNLLILAGTSVMLANKSLTGMVEMKMSPSKTRNFPLSSRASNRGNPAVLFNHANDFMLA